jgi:HK97 family phage portal protein
VKSAVRRLRNAASKPPVPLASTYRRGNMFDLGASKASRETYMRAYGKSGTVFSIVSLLQQAAASPAWHLYKKQPVDGRRRYTTGDQGSDQRVEVINHAALSLWTRPNDFHSGFEFREGSNQHEELTGETFWVLNREVTTFPTSMWYVRPDRMEPVPDPDDYLLGWIYTGPNGEQVPLKRDEVILEKLPDPLDPFRGMGPVASILPNIEQQRYATEYQRNLFINGANPGGLIQVDKRLSDPEYDELVDRWREAHQGVARAGRVAVLEQSATWIAGDGQSNKDLEYGNLRLANRDELREAWRMHKHMLGTVDDVNRANAETAEDVFTGWQTIPRLNRRRSTLNDKLLPMFGASGQGVEFDYENPSPERSEAANTELLVKAQAAQALINAGFGPADVLEVVGLPDMDVAEKATQMPVAPPGWVPGAPPAEPGTPATPAARARITAAGQNGGGKKWVTHPDACDACVANAARGSIPKADKFPGDVMGPPQHPNCQCSLKDTELPAQAADLAALLRRVLSDGYVPVQTTGRR